MLLAAALQAIINYFMVHFSHSHTGCGSSSVDVKEMYQMFYERQVCFYFFYQKQKQVCLSHKA